MSTPYLTPKGVTNMTKELLLTNLQLEKNIIKKKLMYGIITSDDATNQLTMVNKEERKLKEQLVLEKHVNKNGSPRKIKYQESKDLWVTIMADKKKIYSKTRNGLIDKLFIYYDLNIQSKTIKTIFTQALDEKAKTENVNPKTIDRYNYFFNRFIDDEFACRNITEITKADLKAYTQNMVNKLHPKKKAFLGYKSLLNLIFTYAIEYELITSNPVISIKNSIYLKSCDTQKNVSEDKILSLNEIETIKSEIYRRMSLKRYNGYFINGFAILLSIETGMRVGELCSLKWSDIHDNYIHIHSQQLSRKIQGGKEYYLVNWTKNEKGISNGGRRFPLTNAIKHILSELKSIQDAKHITSDFILCHENGEWIKSDAYQTCLRRLMRSLGLPVTNNHTFRMSLNSNIFIPNGIPETTRALLLGHSVETNLKYYSYAPRDAEEEILNILNASSDNNNLVSPRSHQKITNIADYNKKKKASDCYLKGF